MIARLFTILVVAALSVPAASGQRTSLMNDPTVGRVPMAAPGAPPALTAGRVPAYQPGAPLMAASWTYQPPPPLRTFNKHDIVTIRVDEITRVLAESSSESRKITQFQALLTDFIRLDRFRLQPVLFDQGDPSVAGNSNNNFAAEAEIEQNEALTFNIAARIVDIRPGGLLLLEARKAIRVNDNLFETTLSGMCRVQDVAPDNVVLSRDLLDLEIQKEDRGQIRDGSSRGWFRRWFDRVQPF